MLARIDWLNNGIDRMLAGKSPLTPEQWGSPDTITHRDVALLMQASELNSLRLDAAQPDIAFLSKLRSQVATEAEQGA